MTPLLLIGGGGHCRSCIDVIESAGGYRIVGVVDRDKDASPVLGYPVLGDDLSLPELLADFPTALVTVGQIRSPSTRKRLFDLLASLGADSPSIVSQRAYVSRHAMLGKGTIVMHGAIVNASARIGDNCIVNSLALVEHDVQVDDHCHIATGARVNGGVHIGPGTFVGSGTVIREGVHVGGGAIIGAGSIVLRDVAEGACILGVA